MKVKIRKKVVLNQNWFFNLYLLCLVWLVRTVAKKKPEGRNELDGAPAAKKAKTDEQESAIQKELRQHNVRNYLNGLNCRGDGVGIENSPLE